MHMHIHMLRANMKYVHLVLVVWPAYMIEGVDNSILPR